MNQFYKYLGAIVGCLFPFISFAQQTALSNFYQYNWQLQNPAAFDRIYIFDKKKTMMFNATYRSQWAWSDIEGAPVNYSLSFGVFDQNKLVAFIIHAINFYGENQCVN